MCQFYMLASIFGWTGSTTVFQEWKSRADVLCARYPHLGGKQALISQDSKTRPGSFYTTSMESRIVSVENLLGQ